MKKIDSIIDSILSFDASSRSASSANATNAEAPTDEKEKAETREPLIIRQDSSPSATTPKDSHVDAPSPDDQAFPDPAPYPTQRADHGIAFDFNAGARVSIPPGRWHVTLMDIERAIYLFSEEASNCTVFGSKRYFIPTRITVRSLETGETFFTHDYDCRDRDVAIILPGGTLGDAIGWFSYAVKFQEKHQCRLTIAMNAEACALFSGQYPNIRCCTRADYEAEREKFYATYYIGLFFHDDEHHWQPSDFRLVGLHRTAAHILGVDDQEVPPRINHWPIRTRPIDKPYVVIATQASSQCKYWNNPLGWHRVIARLHELGYEIVCIDRAPVGGHHNHINHIPHGTRDETGDRPLTERAYWLQHAAFFIGLSSGLSWLAWAVGTPVVMISGFTHPSNEFRTPYRVFNPHVCNSCWNDVRTPFEHANLLFCPRHANTPRQFECTKLIMPEHVIAYCEQIHQQLTVSAPDATDQNLQATINV